MGNKLDRSGNCSKCGTWRQTLHRDHITPKWKARLLNWAKEIIDATENLQYICANCHEDKTRNDMKGNPGGFQKGENNIAKRVDVREKLSLNANKPEMRKKLTEANRRPEVRAKKSASMKKYLEEHPEARYNFIKTSREDNPLKRAEVQAKLSATMMGNQNGKNGRRGNAPDAFSMENLPRPKQNQEEI